MFNSTIAIVTWSFLKQFVFLFQDFLALKIRLGINTAVLLLQMCRGRFGSLRMQLVKVKFLMCASRGFDTLCIGC